MPDELLNSCRVCQVANQDGEFEVLYTQQRDEFQLTPAGHLYEELLGLKIENATMEVYPRYICNSCELQMKLFKKLKVKANKTLTTLHEMTALLIQAAHDTKKEDVEDVETDTLFNRLPSACVQFYVDSMAEQFENDALSIMQGDELTHENDEPETTCSSSSFVTESFEIMPQTEHETVITKTLIYANTEQEEDGDEVDEIEDFKIETETTSTSDKDEGNVDSSNDYTDVSYLEEVEVTPQQHKNNNNVEMILVESCKANGVRKRKKANTFKCFICALEFTEHIAFVAHRKHVHDNRYPCPECPKLFRTSDALRVHSHQHSDTAPYKCELCPRTFNQKVHYRYHMDRHNNIRNFKCNDCDKAFLSKADLTAHVRTHTGERRYSCEICGKDFLMLQHLKMHQYSHSEKSFECTICKQKFLSPNTLRTHIITIHEKEPQFECKICLRRFRRKHHLTAHYKVHTDNIKKRQQKAIFEFMEITEAEQLENISVMSNVIDMVEEQQQEQQQEQVESITHKSVKGAEEEEVVIEEMDDTTDDLIAILVS